MDSDKLQLRELVPADPFIQSPGWPWWVWLLIALAIVGIAFLICLIVRRSDSASGPDPRLEAENAYRAAMERIKGAANLSAVQEAATSCSDAIRRYLATVTGDPSLYETHEEFLARHESLDGFPVEVRNGVSAGFSRLARLKYGKSPSGEPFAIADEGLSLLDQLHQHRPA